MSGRDLVEPEGVNAGSAEAMEEEAGEGDPVAGGDPDTAPAQQEAVGELVGPPPEPAGDEDDVFGSRPPA